LTLTEDGQTLDGDSFQNHTSLETLVLANGSNKVTLDTSAADLGIEVVIGGAGRDTLDASGYGSRVSFVGGGGSDTLIGGGSGDNLLGTNSTALGANERDTLTGGGGADLFVLGDATNAYYNTGARNADYAIITDFAAADKIQLTDLSALYKPTAPLANNYGYVAGSNDIYAVGALGVGINSYIYVDTDKTGTITTGDNLIAAVNSTAGALTDADLLTTKFSIV
jgi:hypothetical protein